MYAADVFVLWFLYFMIVNLIYLKLNKKNRLEMHTFSANLTRSCDLLLLRFMIDVY